jgi:hypothetical protein
MWTINTRPTSTRVLPGCNTSGIGARTASGRRSTGSVLGVAAHDRQVFRYRLDFGGGERDVVSLLEPDWVFQHGLHPEAVLGVVRDGADPVALAPVDLRENGPFLQLLSRVIFENIADCGDMRREAEMQGSGYVYLLDARTPNPAGRVPAEDIIGVVQVDGGAAVAGSYQHNPKHRLFTATGWFRLPYDLEAAMQRRLRARTTD